MPVFEDHTIKLLARWIPVVVLADLCLALVARAWDWPPQPTYVALGLTLVGTLAAAVAYPGSVRGVRSMEDAGFQSSHAWLTYTLSWRGLRPSAVVLIVATVIVTIYAGLNQTTSGLLSFFTLPLAALNQAITRRYPADIRATDD